MAYIVSNPKRGINILTTLATMLIDREYKICEPDCKVIGKTVNVNVSSDYYDNNELLMIAKNEKNNETIYVMCPKEEKLAIDTVRKYVKTYKFDKQARLIIVIQNITSSARQEIETCKKFEIFYEKELYWNKTKHVLYVPHVALTNEEEEKLLQTYKCTKDNLPCICKNDPIVRYFGWNVGQVIKISHALGGSQEPFEYYRVVINQ